MCIYSAIITGRKVLKDSDWKGSTRSQTWAECNPFYLQTAVWHSVLTDCRKYMEMLCYYTNAQVITKVETMSPIMCLDFSGGSTPLVVPRFNPWHIEPPTQDFQVVVCRVPSLGCSWFTLWHTEPPTRDFQVVVCRVPSLGCGSPYDTLNLQHRTSKL
jgi:hypothetical protein